MIFEARAGSIRVMTLCKGSPRKTCASSTVMSATVHPGGRRTDAKAVDTLARAVDERNGRPSAMAAS